VSPAIWLVDIPISVAELELLSRFLSVNLMAISECTSGACSIELRFRAKEGEPKRLYLLRRCRVPHAWGLKGAYLVIERAIKSPRSAGR
jgi:hypothetical protein